MTLSAIAAKLKEEGNALFVKKEYGLAIAKYSEAIAAGGDNSVLYANRAACQLALHQFLNAVDDAKQATKLDPLYSKAWARLATARDGLNEYHHSVEAWQRAVDTLPMEDVTPGALKQREQYAAGLKNAKQRLAKPGEPDVVILNSASGKMPWHLAQTERANLDLSTSEGRRSSVWVILEAYEEFSEGVKTMMATKKINTPRGDGVVGMPNAIEPLTNGIMRDERVFHMEDPDWLKKYNIQVMFESARVQAWVEDGPDRVKLEAQKRLRAKGWKDVRTALAVTVRGWIMRGFVEGGMRGNHVSREEFFHRAIDIVEWGRSVWKNVSREDRGMIFEETFLRGLRAMHLEAIRQLISSNSNAKYTLDDLHQQAMEATKAVVPISVTGPVGPGFVSSFYLFPVGEAHATIGWYHGQMAQKSLPDVEASIGHRHSAAESYLIAADVFPEDDERHVWFLGVALDNMFQAGSRLRETTEVMKRIRVAAPKMRKIWQNSSLSQARDRKIVEVAEFEKEVLSQLEQGLLKLDDRVGPKMSSR